MLDHDAFFFGGIEQDALVRDHSVVRRGRSAEAGAARVRAGRTVHTDMVSPSSSWLGVHPQQGNTQVLNGV